MIYQVFAVIMGTRIQIDLCNTEEQFKTITVGQLKEKILQQGPRKFAQYDLRLIFEDRPLNGDSTLLCDYGIQHLSYIHLVLKIPEEGGGGPLVKGEEGSQDLKPF